MHNYNIETTILNFELICFVVFLVKIVFGSSYESESGRVVSFGIYYNRCLINRLENILKLNLLPTYCMTNFVSVFHWRQ